MLVGMETSWDAAHPSPTTGWSLGRGHTHLPSSSEHSLVSRQSCFAAGDALPGVPRGTGCSLCLQQRYPLHSASHPRGLHRKDILKITAGTKFIFDKGAN